MRANGKYIAKDGLEFFMCPFTDFVLTCGPNESKYHMGTQAIDVRGAVRGVRYAYYAPATSRCIKTYPSSGQAMWQTVNNVHCSNGYTGKVTYMTVHDDTLNAIPGQTVVPQGSQLGNMGTKGNASGVHCHIEFSESADTSWFKNSYGNYMFNNEVDPENVMYMNDTNIIYGYGNWKYIPSETHKIGYQCHVQDEGWQDWKFDGQTAGTTGKSKRMEAIRIDYKGDVYAKAHIQDIGWEDYGKIDINTIIGTTGESKRLECLCLKGNFKYRVHIQDSGWTNWTNADGIATMGTVGQALRMEAIEIVEL